MNIKKILSGITALSLLAGIAIPVSAAEKKGDLNNDNIVNIVDYMTMKQYLVNVNPLDEQAILNADMNESGSVNIFDAVLLAKQLVTPESETTTEPIETTEPTVTTETDVTDTPVEEDYTISLLNTSIETNCSTVSINGTVATITAPGTYIITGTLDDGQIIVDVDKDTYVDGKVELSLEGVNITSSNNSPIYVASIDDECVITAKKGTENVISDGTSYTNADESSGAIYSKDDLKIKGKGTLMVNGNCEDGIVSKNDLKIFNGNIIVKAVDDGIRGKDSVKIGDADDIGTDGAFDNLSVVVNAQSGNGITSNSTEEAGKGVVTINGGLVNVTAYADGIHGATELNVVGGDITVETTCAGSSSGGSSWGGSSGSTTTEVSAKGLKAGCTDDDTSTVIEGTINISGGTMNVNSTDDSIHATNINITGGDMTLSTGDDGIHADTNLTIDDGVIDILKSYEGIEATNIVVNGGNIHMVASDDGYNAAGGNDGSGNTNQGGFGGGMMSSSSGTLTINGGYTFMQAKGDGLDSNGPLYLNGGTVVVNGYTSGDTSPLDADGTVSYSGGTVLAYGASNMMVTPSSYSFLTTSGNISSGTVLTFANGTEVLSTVTVPSGCAGQYIVYCSPTQNVTCYTGGTVTGATMIDEYYGEGGTISGGTEISAGSSSGGNSNRPF